MKKTWFVVGGVIGVVILVVATIAVVRFRKPAVISPLGETPTQKAQLVIWEDPAGFKFSYPEGIKINSHEEDTVNYAHLELTATGHPRGILIWMKDTNYKTIDEWAKKETGEGQVFDSGLGGKPAKKVAYGSPRKLVVAALDVDVLVLIEVTPEDKWWEETYNQILSSFEFIPLAGKETEAPGAWQGEGGGGGVIEEEEEVVE